MSVNLPGYYARFDQNMCFPRVQSRIVVGHSDARLLAFAFLVKMADFWVQCQMLGCDALAARCLNAYLEDQVEKGLPPQCGALLTIATFLRRFVLEMAQERSFSVERRTLQASLFVVVQFLGSANPPSHQNML